jgi:hypothetical protein
MPIPSSEKREDEREYLVKYGEKKFTLFRAVVFATVRGFRKFHGMDFGSDIVHEHCCALLKTGMKKNPEQIVIPERYQNKNGMFI